MYIAQQMLSLLEDGAKPNIRMALAQVGLLSRWEETTKLFRSVLDDYELFAFDQSALVPASDIRTDNHRGLLGIAGHVTRRPRRLFIECSQSDLEITMPQFEFDYALPPEERTGRYGIIKRRGVVMDIHGNGTCTIQTINRSEFETEKRRMLKEGLSREEANFISNMVQLSPSMGEIKVDMNRALEVTREEFVSELPKDLSNAEIETEWARYQVDERFWAQTSKTTLNTEYEGGFRPLEDHMVELIGIFQAGIAMAAVLELKDTELTPRPVVLPRKTGSGIKRRVQDGTNVIQGSRKRSISIVTMHLSEEILISMRNREDRVPKDPSPERRGTPRALHYVRGHLFLARNGQIVYRKPHFRGRAGLRTLTKAVA